MSRTARRLSRGCATVGTLGLALTAGPAWALDLPSVPPVAGAPTAALPSPLPAPVASLLPAPVASALEPITSKLPGNSPSPKPTPAPSATRPAPAPAPQPEQQHAQAATGVAELALPATLAFRAGRADLQELPGVVAPVAVAPVPVTPQLAPDASLATSTRLPDPASNDGLPALVVALAIGAATAAAAGQLAEMHARGTAAG